MTSKNGIRILDILKFINHSDMVLWRKFNPNGISMQNIISYEHRKLV